MALIALLLVILIFTGHAAHTSEEINHGLMFFAYIGFLTYNFWISSSHGEKTIFL